MKIQINKINKNGIDIKKSNTEIFISKIRFNDGSFNFSGIFVSFTHIYMLA